MRNIFSIIFFSFLATTIIAQDKHFSQFYAIPISMNPALTGAFDGSFRVGTIYRDQWRGALDNPFTTFSGAIDLRFDVGQKRIFRDAVSGGILFFSDRVGTIDFNTNQMALTGAYHKALDRRSTQYLSAGLKFGFSQKNINYESLSFQDQFNGIDNFNQSTGEDLPENNFSYADMAVGLYYTITPERNTSFYAGAALHHFNRANASFYSNEENSVTHKIFLKSLVHLGARIPIGQKMQLFPKVLATVQGPHIEFNAGSNLRINMNDYSSFALHLGTWIRPVKYDDGFNIDAIIVLAGIEYENILFGLSYDANLNSIINYSKAHGAFEFSIVYLGNYENETILCPTF